MQHGDLAAQAAHEFHVMLHHHHRAGLRGDPPADRLRIHQQGVRVDPATAVIAVDGLRITVPEAAKVYLALNKPVGVLSTMSDDRGRMTLTELLPDRVRESGTRLFHVGRLDSDTEGLLLLTNDGDLANRVAHPSHGVDKEYLAEVDKPACFGNSNAFTDLMAPGAIITSLSGGLERSRAASSTK